MARYLPDVPNSVALKWVVVRIGGSRAHELRIFAAKTADAAAKQAVKDRAARIEAPRRLSVGVIAKGGTAALRQDAPSGKGPP